MKKLLNQIKNSNSVKRIKNLDDCWNDGMKKNFREYFQEQSDKLLDLYTDIVFIVYTLCAKILLFLFFAFFIILRLIWEGSKKKRFPRSHNK